MALVVGEDLDLGDWDDIVVVLLRRCKVFAALAELLRCQSLKEAVVNNSYIPWPSQQRNMTDSRSRRSYYTLPQRP